MGRTVTGRTIGACPVQPVEADDVRRMTVFVRGRVQGVGFRWWTRARALELGLAGHARNTADGRVEVVAEGAGGRRSQRLLDAAASRSPSSHPPARPGRVGVEPAVGRAARDAGFLER